MADEPQVLRGINWREALPFTHIFRAFRIAMHPSKLVLGLLAVLSLYLGGRVLDRAWMDQHRAVPAGPAAAGEILMYEQSVSNEQFAAARESARQSIARDYAGLVRWMAGVKGWQGLTDPAEAQKAAEQGLHTDHVKYEVKRRIEGEVADARTTFEQADKATDEAAKRAEEAHNSAIRAAYDRARADLRTVERVEGQGLFVAFFEYQTLQIRKIAFGVLSGNWLGGLQSWIGGQPVEVAVGDGVVVSVIKFFTVAPWWALWYHPLYFILFGSLFLVVWSLFGGAIARIAAVHVADEGRKLSMRQGLSFATSKFLSFLSAPLLPLIIVFVIGAVLALVAALAFLIRLDIVVGLLYVLALAAGFVMTLVLLGTAGGFNLMYPTIAVEGSDSFDAISRSFSYVYARPWRMLFYSALALAYGALTYLFVRVFIWLVLVLTHFFVGRLVYRDAGNLNDLWTTLQPRPEFGHLPYRVDWNGLNWYGDATAWLVALWSYVAIAMLGAFAISFYFSVNTIIYYLMRREVDATEMDDVFLEQPEEEFVETTAAAGEGGAVEGTAGGSAEGAPPGSEPPSEEKGEPPAGTPPGA